jgi:peptidoglycan/xylan/chitin deacetylase (PgdA/CDA1 family)
MTDHPYSWSHPDLATLGDADVRSQMTQLEDVLLQMIGLSTPGLIRPQAKAVS